MNYKYRYLEGTRTQGLTDDARNKLLKIGISVCLRSWQNNLKISESVIFLQLPTTIEDKRNSAVCLDLYLND